MFEKNAEILKTGWAARDGDPYIYGSSTFEEDVQVIAPELLAKKVKEGV